MAQVRAKYAELYKIWGGRPGGAADVRLSSRSAPYNFTRPEYMNDLIALGRGSFICDANGVVGSDGVYSVRCTYTIDDWFADVLDPRNRFSDSAGWREFDNCMPYPITGTWSSVLSGSIQ
jgi:hypothetical protein